MAFNLGLVEEGQLWMDMIESRNRTVHAYDESVLLDEFTKIRAHYTACFQQLEQTLAALCTD